MLKQLLSINRKHKQAIFFVWISTFLGAALGFVTQVILARTLGTESYGALTSTLGLIGILTPLAGFGISGFWLKCFGEEGWGAVRWLKPSFKFILFSTAVTIASIYIWGFLGPNDQLNRTLICILAWTVLGTLYTNLVCTKFQLEDKFPLFSITESLQPVLKTIFVVITVFLFPKNILLQSIAWSLFFVSIIVMIILQVQISKFHKGDLKLSGHGSPKLSDKQHGRDPNVLDVYRETWVFGAAGVLYLAWSQGHIVLSKYFLGNYQAGVYSSAMVLLNAICLFPSVLYTKYMLPKIHRWANHDLKMLKKAYFSGNKAMFFIGIFSMLLVGVLSSWGVVLIFGEKYRAAGNLLRVLSLTLPIRFLGYSVGALLVTKHHMRLKIKILVTVAVFNYLLAIMLMPIWGLYGLASTIAVSEAILVFCYSVVVKKIYLSHI